MTGTHGADGFDSGATVADGARDVTTVACGGCDSGGDGPATAATLRQ